MTIDQFLSIGKKCSMCDQKATWLASMDAPAYCDRHFPYIDTINSLIFVENPLLEEKQISELSKKEGWAKLEAMIDRRETLPHLEN